MNRTAHRRGFSLIELVIVVVIIGIIAAIAIPRMSRGSAGAADSALSGNLTVLRNAIELYATEHNGEFPGAATGSDMTAQLTGYTNDAGTVSATQSASYPYGPYLRKVPVLGVGTGANKSLATVQTVAAGGTPNNTAAWYYEKDTGVIKANLADSVVSKVSGVPYNQF